MSGIVYFDSFASVGKRMGSLQNLIYNFEDVSSELRRCGIAAALLTHTLARDYDPVVGNKTLVEEFGGRKNFVPCFVLRPDDLGEFPPIEKYLDEYEVRAVKLYPRTHLYTFDEFTCGNILDSIERREIPLFIEGGRRFVPGFNQASIQELDKVCSAHPKLKVVLQGSRWDGMRDVFYLMKKHENVMLEFSSQQVNHGIEFFAHQFGAKRLLFGTQFPVMSIGAARMFLDYADIKEEERRLIAGVNLAELLRVSLPGETLFSEDDDRILVAVKLAKPLTQFNVIDAHAHIVVDEAHVAYSPWLFSGADDILKSDCRLGIRKTCVSEWLGLWLDHEKGNEATFSAMSKYPDHFVGYGAFDPTFVRDWESLLDHWYLKRRFLGIKPYYPRNEIPYNSEKWHPIFAFGDKHSLFALLHPSDNFVSEVDEIAVRYPDLKLLLAHSGLNFKHASDVCDVARKHNNVYLELTFTDVLDGVIEFMVGKAGARKILFGTDQPMRDSSPQLGWVAYSRLSEDEKVQILGTNMQNILDGTHLPS